MNSKIRLIIEREFTERVRKKSFIIVTILTPFLLVLCMFGPMLLIGLSSDSAKTQKVAVVDNSQDQYVGTRLESDDKVEFSLLPSGTSTEEAHMRYARHEDFYGVLVIGEDILNNPGDMMLINHGTTSMGTEEIIRNRIQGILRNERLSRYENDNISQILADANIRVNIRTMEVDTKAKNGDGIKASSTGASYGLGLILAMVIYMIIIVYGQQVLQSVIDEKQTRVLDVIITSCKPFELMMGKVLGIALVAFLQILIWGVLILVFSTIIAPLVLGNMGIDLSSATQAMSASGSPEFAVIVSKITDLSYLSKLFISMLLYIVGGFLFYASMYAAIGSAVDTPQDAAQFNSVLMIPIMIAIYAMIAVMQNPSSDMAFWFSIIPFTSPVVMMARIPFGIPTWEIVVSVAVLYISFVIMIWLAARIFRVGVFMHGKKPTWKDLGDWIRMK